MPKIRIGTPDYLSIRPLIFGLVNHPEPGIEIVYDRPGLLAEALDRGHLDAAMIPSLDYLRGIGRHHIQGPALLVKDAPSGLMLATAKPLAQVRRIAVDENSRTSLAVLRVVLDRLHGVLPDFCVFKADPKTWRESFDGILLTGDRGLEYCREKSGDENCHDIAEMWKSLHQTPLVLALWAYNDDKLGPRLEKAVVRSRDFGVDNFNLLSDGLARTSSFEPHFLKRCFETSWGFDLGARGDEGLRLLESLSLEYRLIHSTRLEKALTH